MSEQQANSKKKKWNTRGFYIALSVSLVAVGIAAWTTYDSITGNLNSATDVSQSTVDSKKTPTGQTSSGVLEESFAVSQLESKVSGFCPLAVLQSRQKMQGVKYPRSRRKHLLRPLRYQNQRVRPSTQPSFPIH